MDLSKELISHLYLDMGHSDREIAEFIGLHRATISKIRNDYGIETRQSVGELGEKYAKKKLIQLGHTVIDMNETNKTAPFDLMVNGRIRIEVKSAMEQRGEFKFVMTDKEENKNIESNHRIKLSSGRTKKVYRKTCDFIIFVGVKGKSALPIIIPSKLINDRLQTLSFPLSGQSKYSEFVNAWQLIKG